MPSVLSLMVLAQRADLTAALPIACAGLVVGVALGTIVGAVILRAAAQWAVKVDLPFGRACLISLLNAGIGFALSFAIGMFVAFAHGPVAQDEQIKVPWPVHVLSLMLSFLVATALYGSMIKTEDYGRPIGFAKGAKVALMTYLIGLAIAAVVVGLVFVVSMSTGYKFW